MNKIILITCRKIDFKDISNKSANTSRSIQKQQINIGYAKYTNYFIERWNWGGIKVVAF